MAVLGAAAAATALAFTRDATVVVAETAEDTVGLPVVLMDWALIFWNCVNEDASAVLGIYVKRKIFTQQNLVSNNGASETDLSH